MVHASPATIGLICISLPELVSLRVPSRSDKCDLADAMPPSVELSLPIQLHQVCRIGVSRGAFAQHEFRAAAVKVSCHYPDRRDAWGGGRVRALDDIHMPASRAEGLNETALEVQCSGCWFVFISFFCRDVDREPLHPTAQSCVAASFVFDALVIEDQPTLA